MWLSAICTAVLSIEMVFEVFLEPRIHMIDILKSAKREYRFVSDGMGQYAKVQTSNIRTIY